MFTITQLEQSESPRTWEPVASWECGGYAGHVYQTVDGGYAGDSASFILAEDVDGMATVEGAARAAYNREVVVGTALQQVQRKFQIAYPDCRETVRVWGVAFPAGTNVSDPAVVPGARMENLSPWMREAVGIARANRNLCVHVNEGTDIRYSFVLMDRRIAISRNEGGELAQWVVENGCRIRAEVF